jgi:hypothetical protein
VRILTIAAGLRRQYGGDRLAGAGGVVLGRPLRQPHDVLRNERLGIEQLLDRLDPVDLDLPSRRRIDLDDDAGDQPRSQRHDHPRADDGDDRRVGNQIGEEVETGNRDGYANQHADTCN